MKQLHCCLLGFSRDQAFYFVEIIGSLSRNDSVRISSVKKKTLLGYIHRASDEFSANSEKFVR